MVLVDDSSTSVILAVMGRTHIPPVLLVLVPVPDAVHRVRGPDGDADPQNWTRLDYGLGLGRSF